MLTKKLFMSGSISFNDDLFLDAGLSSDCFYIPPDRPDIVLLFGCKHNVSNFRLPSGNYWICACGAGADGDQYGCRSGIHSTERGAGGGSSVPVSTQVRISKSMVVTTYVPPNGSRIYPPTYGRDSYVNLNGARCLTATCGPQKGGSAGSTIPGRGASAGPTYISELPGGSNAVNCHYDNRGGGHGAGSRFPYFKSIARGIGCADSRCGWANARGKGGYGWGAGGGGAAWYYDYGSLAHCPGYGNPGIILIQKVGKFKAGDVPE